MVNTEMTKTTLYLEQFSKVADEWFLQNEWFEERYLFFRNFFKYENIINLEWSRIQEIGDQIHAFNSLAIAKGNALGKPNLPIEKYREVFEYLIRGEHPINERINNLLEKNGDYQLKRFGPASISELIGYAFPEEYVFHNRRDEEALLFLGITVPIESGSKFGDYFLAYNKCIEPIIEEYERIVGKRTTTSIPLEVDQFFSWLYETHIAPIKSKSDIYFTLIKFINQAQTTNLKKSPYPKTFRDLTFRVSFGAGATANVPWIAFLKEPNTVSEGIYPVYLYYKQNNLLILAYGVSETVTPPISWPKTDEFNTIENWFVSNHSEKPFRYGSSFVKAVYDLKEELEPDVIQQDLDEMIFKYKQIEFENQDLEEVGSSKKRYWLIAPGEGAHNWDEFLEKGIATIGGWGHVGDLSAFDDKDSIKEVLIKLNPDSQSSQRNIALALWEFSRVMDVGDILIPKKGTEYYLGYGIVKSDYYFDESKDEYQHTRKVDWVKSGKWQEDVHQIVTKTLTDITQYPEYVDRLRRLIGIEQEASISLDKNYFWMNANPKIWRIDDFEVGSEQQYTTHNEKGNKSSRYECFEIAKPGDLMVGYQSSPVKKVVAIYEISEGLHIDEDDGLEKISFQILKFLPNPTSWADIKDLPEMSNSEILKNHQGSLFLLTKEEFNSIQNFELKESEYEEYLFADACKQLFIEDKKLLSYLAILEYKKNIILQGPPGTGKTFMAKRLAYSMMEEKNESRIQMVQFHQSYSYEDFIQGFRPTDEGTFKLVNGVFYRFCKRAQNDPDNPYFFIIDEINRGNLSKIFGELMFLIEADKRGQDFEISLTYSQEMENKFFIPSNLYMIGTMNTADRSLAVVDYGLRRRFAFIDVMPLFNKKFETDLLDKGVDEGIIQDISNKIDRLNSTIRDDIGDGFQIGHSYFCNVPEGSGDEDWYKQIVNHEIAPLLREYWFDKEEKASIEIDKLIE